MREPEPLRHRESERPAPGAPHTVEWATESVKPEAVRVGLDE